MIETFPDFMAKIHGNKKKNFTYEHMLHAWIRGQISVVEFEKAGGSVRQLEKVLSDQFEVESRILRSGSVDEMKAKIDLKLMQRRNNYGK